MKNIRRLKKQQRDNFIPVSSNIDENIETLDTIFKDCTDVVTRELKVGVEQNHRMYVAYLDGMADKALVHEHILRPLMLEARLIAPDPGDVKQELFKLSSQGTLSVSDIKEKNNLDEAVLGVLSGDTIVLIDGVDQFLLISTRGWPLRGLSEPEGEAVIRGAREGFIETFRVNTVLLRRKIRDPRLKIEGMQLGERSKTDIGITYIEDIVDRNVLKEVKKRLETIKIDAILESGYVEQLIEDNWFSFFPQVQYTERPDIVAAAMLEGKVAILIDNTPMALILPVTLNDFMHSPEDYYERFWIGTALRWIRLISLIISFVLPSIYIATASYHPGIIPTRLALFIAGTREGVPFPVFIEALLMEVTFELLREAGVRLPGQIGSTIGIVGSLIIGQAAVEAGLVSPIMVIIVALTAISSFTIPNYNFTISFRILRFAAMIASSILGLYGLILVVIMTIVHLASLKSFGIPYLIPFVATNTADLKDGLMKKSLISMETRNSYVGQRNNVRMKDLRLDRDGKAQVDESKKNQEPVQEPMEEDKKEPKHILKKPKKIGGNQEKGGDNNGQQ